MKQRRGTFRKQAALLLAVVLLDGALLGTAGGIAGSFWSTHTPYAVSRGIGPAAGIAARIEAGSKDRTAAPDAAAFENRQGGMPDAAAAEGGQGGAPDAAAYENGQGGMSDAAAAEGGQSGTSDAAVTADGSVEGGASELPKLVALTFDDGPHQTCTPKLLDGLKARNVKATFFLMGENIAGKEDLVRRMQAEGHLIGNHSYRHIQLTHAGEDAVCEAIEKTEAMIEEITGVRPDYLRPPYGDWNESLECRMDLTTVFWSVDSLDWKLKNTKQIVKRVKQETGEGDIILMHDIFPTSVEAALQIVDQLQSQGYTFVTVDELLID